jgi:hypothetical protein
VGKRREMRDDFFTIDVALELMAGAVFGSAAEAV